MNNVRKGKRSQSLVSVGAFPSLCFVSSPPLLLETQSSSHYCLPSTRPDSGISELDGKQDTDHPETKHEAQTCGTEHKGQGSESDLW